MLTELDSNTRAILLTVKDIMKEQGHNSVSFSDAVKYLANELGIEPSATHLEAETEKKESD